MTVLESESEKLYKKMHFKILSSARCEKGAYIMCSIFKFFFFNKYLNSNFQLNLFSRYEYEL